MSRPVTASGHTSLRKEPFKRLALKAFLLAGYCFFFSVQICFRYNTDSSLDLDAYSSKNFVHALAHGPVSVQLHHKAGRTHHILNKRFEPVQAHVLPVQEFRLSQLYVPVHREFCVLNEALHSRNLPFSPLRGPPAPVC